MADKNYWWKKAQEASAKVGWFPTVIFAQWAWETGHFESANLKNNNNIAGQTWTKQYPESMKGTARPAKEGGNYVKFADPVDGYVDFIQRNPRYNNVKLAKTEEDQIRTIAADGWAVDKNYANGLISTLNAHKKAGYTLESLKPKYKLTQEVANTVINTWLGPAWGKQPTQKDKDRVHNLANDLRRASGLLAPPAGWTFTKEMANEIISTWISPDWFNQKTQKDKDYLNWLANQLRIASGQPTK